MIRLRRLAAPGSRIPEFAIALFVCANLAWMAAWPALHEIQSSLIFLALAAGYGWRSWRPATTLAAVAASFAVVAVIVILLDEPATTDEVSELVGLTVMLVLFLAIVHQIDSRTRALDAADAVAEERAEGLERERFFFARASHELATPLTIARGHLETLGRGGPASREQVEATRTVVLEELQRMEDLVGELLLSARLASSSITRERVEVEELMIAVASRWTALDGRAWQLWLDAPGTIDAAPVPLMRALEALIENAYRHTREGDPIVIAAFASDDGERLLMKVEDRGHGIPADALPHVFERFYRVDGAPAKGRRGSGLGLAIVKAVVDAHDGMVSIQSRPDRGTRVVMELPRYAPSRRPPTVPLDDAEAVAAAR